MILDLKKVFLEEDETLPFACDLDLSETEIGGYHPFISPVKVKGFVRHEAGAAFFQAETEFVFCIPCDRCAEEIKKEYRYTFQHMLAPVLNDEDHDLYLQIEGYQLDVDELLRADILLELPSKYLCKPDCRGLCPKCGKNLNSGSCDCNTHQIDPRLEVLKQLID